MVTATAAPARETEWLFLRKQIIEFKEVFEFITSGKGDPANGIHPVFINGKYRGLRLGKEKPAENGESVCFTFGAHHGEVGAWNAAKQTLDMWRKKGRFSYQKRLPANDNLPELKGDIYLMFAGEHEQMEACFEYLLNLKDLSEIDPQKWIQFRNTLEHNVNRNRVPATPETIIQTPTHQTLHDDHQEMEEKVFRHCKAIIDYHSMSQESEPIALPYFEKLNDTEDALMEDLGPLLLAMGAKLLIPGTNVSNGMRDTRYIVECPEFRRDDDPLPKGKKPAIRMTYEGGGPDLSRHVFEHAGKAALAAIAHLFNLEKKLFFNRDYSSPEVKELQVFSDINNIYMPDSPRNCFNPKDSCILPLHLSPLLEDEWGDTVYLLNGNELPKEHLDELEAALQALGRSRHEIKAGQLGNRCHITKGTPIAYTTNGKNIVPLLAPYDGYCFMAPGSGRFKGKDPNYLLFLARKSYSYSKETDRTLSSFIDRTVNIGRTASAGM